MRRLLLLLTILLLFPAKAPAMAPLVVADLSSHLIAVTSGFSGTNLLLFGAMEGKGDVVVVIRGPDRDFTVRRKGETLGIWINQGMANITAVPAFYFVAASKPLDQIADPAVLQRLGILPDMVRFRINREDSNASNLAYTEAMLRLLRHSGLYTSQPARVQVLAERLFRTDVLFPSNVPVGVYGVEVYLFQNGQVISAQTTPLTVSRDGLEAEIVRFAVRDSLWYGLLVVVLSVLLGWAASVIFRRHD